MENTSPFSPGVHVIITEPGSSLQDLLRTLLADNRCLIIDMDGTATAMLSGYGGQWVSALSSYDLADTVAKVVCVGRNFRMIIFISLNTLAELSRYKRITKTWMRDFYRDLLLISSLCANLGETTCLIHIAPNNVLKRFLGSWQSKIYERLGGLWIYRADNKDFIQISYTTRENKS